MCVLATVKRVKGKAAEAPATNFREALSCNFLRAALSAAFLRPARSLVPARMSAFHPLTSRAETFMDILSASDHC